MPTNDSADIQVEIGHVLFVDIVGYSKLLITEQAERIQTLRQIIRGSDQFRRAELEGQLSSLSTGDGAALVFRTSSDAPLLCAIEISNALKANPELHVRMGIHSGPVKRITDVNEQSNLAGAGINTAQRVMDCGDAGHILLSRHVAEDLEHFPRWRPLLHDLGDCQVKHEARIGIVNFYDETIGNAHLPIKIRIRNRKRLQKQGIAAAAVILSLAAVLFVLARAPFTRRSVNSEKSIAILPFENLSGDKENAYFAEGLHDEILTRLSKIADLKVISRTSVQQYRGTTKNIDEIARQLGVAHIVEGSVQKNGDAVRVNAQLIRATNQAHVWAETFDRKLSDIFSVESEVAKIIADQLQANVSAPERQNIAAKLTDNPTAYDAYLRGVAFSQRIGATSDNALSARNYFGAAVQIDPNFALAWAALSRINSAGYSVIALPKTAATCEDARKAAEKALALQPDLGEGLLAQALYRFNCQNDPQSAESYLKRARASLPNDSQIPRMLAAIARQRGDWKQADNYFQSAEQLDPRNPQLLFAEAGFFTFQRRFYEARHKCEQVLNLIPDDTVTLVQEAGIAQAQGDLQESGALLKRLPLTNKYVLYSSAYQAILERKPSEMIPRIEEQLATNISMLPDDKAETKVWLGWLKDLAGDHAGAVENWRRARQELEPNLEHEPENYFLIKDLALLSAHVGDKQSALNLAERGIRVAPLASNALFGPMMLDVMSRVAALTGEHERAIATLQSIVSRPYAGPLPANSPITPALLRLDPTFDSLRDDPRYANLTKDIAPDHSTVAR